MLPLNLTLLLPSSLHYFSFFLHYADVLLLEWPVHWTHAVKHAIRHRKFPISNSKFTFSSSTFTLVVNVHDVPPAVVQRLTCPLDFFLLFTHLFTLVWCTRFLRLHSLTPEGSASFFCPESCIALLQSNTTYQCHYVIALACKPR